MVHLRSSPKGEHFGFFCFFFLCWEIDRCANSFNSDGPSSEFTTCCGLDMICGYPNSSCIENLPPHVLVSRCETFKICSLVEANWLMGVSLSEAMNGGLVQ